MNVPGCATGIRRTDSDVRILSGVLTHRGQGLIGLLTATAILASCSSPPSTTETPEVHYTAPSTSRPVVDLAFTVSDDLESIAGTEKVTFTPDQQVCEVVFRAWPNKPATAERGNSMIVSSISVDGASLPVVTEAAGAPSGSPGTLVRAELPECVSAGTQVSADVAFEVELGRRTDERMGHAPREDVAWFGSAYPMPAWVNGRGWQENPAVDVVGEMAASDAFELRDLAVSAPSRYKVAAVGEQTRSSAGEAEGTTTHHFTSPAVRDVAVVVGDLVITQVDGGPVPVIVAMPAGSSRIKGTAQEWADETSGMLSALEKHFGTYPYDRVWVQVLPGVSDGVEYGEAFQIAGRHTPYESRWLIAHELAHAWFYGLVGNNQGENPWLDESFATYAQELVDPSGLAERQYPGLSGRLGEPMTWWNTSAEHRGEYEDTVYSGGAWALLQARAAVGGERFDSLIRDYLAAHAHGFVGPADLETALRTEPEALRPLQEAGAWTSR